MQPDAYRRSLGLSQAAFAAELGGLSKGYISRLETGRQPWPLKLALKLEQRSGGRVSALALVDEADASLLVDFASRLAGHPPTPAGRA